MCTIALFVSLFECGGEPKRTTLPTPPSSGTATAGPPFSKATIDTTGCIVVSKDIEGLRISIEGVLTKAHGNTIDAPFVLRLTRPRCVVGLEHASFVTEVYVASTGPDLRPLLDARLRITGKAIGGMNDVGGSAVIVLATDLERLLPNSQEP